MEENVRPVVKKEEKEKKPRLACWHSHLPAGARLVRSRAGWRPLHRPWCLVLRCWRRVRVPPPDKLDQTARGGQVQE